MGYNVGMKKEKAIYKIENKLDGKKYIGSTVSLKQRFNRHKNDLKGNRHENKYLQNAWNRDKEENFTVKVIEILPDFLPLNKIRKIEEFFIFSEDWEELYNLSKTTHTYAPSEERKKELSDKAKGNSWAKGAIRSEEMREKLRQHNRKSGSGIRYKVKTDKYEVSIATPEQRYKYLGVFKTYQEALECRLKAEEHYWNDSYKLGSKDYDVNSSKIYKKSGAGISATASGKYAVSIHDIKNKKTIHLGTFASYEEALAVRLVAEKKYWVSPQL